MFPNPKGYANPQLLITRAELAARLGVSGAARTPHAALGTSNVPGAQRPASSASEHPAPRTQDILQSSWGPTPTRAAPRGISSFERGPTPARAAGADSLGAAAAGAAPGTSQPDVAHGTSNRTLHVERSTLNVAPIVIDLRPAESFATAHIPTAIHLDLFGVSLIDTDPAPLNAFLWMIGHLLTSRGVASDRTVVVYDDQSGMRAARAFWFLEFFGHPDPRLLDGGFGAWQREGFPATMAADAPRKVEWEPGRADERLATWRDVRDRLGRRDAVMLDTRSDGEYCGTTVRAKRGGAIPGAVHIEWTRNLDATGAFKPAAELRQMYETAGVTPDREVISYCQGGYRAAHGYLALRLIGYPRVRNYIGSWKEWGDREDLPIEVPRQLE